METFFCDADYQEYLSLLGHWCGEFEVRITDRKFDSACKRLVNPE